MKDEVTVFAPASVANVGCGYDVLGFALQDLGDLITIERTSSNVLEISQITGDNSLPSDPNSNVATVAADALLRSLTYSPGGFRFKIKKMVKPGSGLGSSASSAAAAVFGINELLNRPFEKTDLVKYAGEGEKAASGKVHYDNVAAAIFGGFTLIRSRDPLDIVELSYPEELFVVIAHPQVEIKTADARKILKNQISLSNAITQWANLSGFTAGLLTGDFDLMGRSMNDVIAEPIRSILIPSYKNVKAAALESGALGCNIAGSGPSIFSLCKGKETAEKVREAIQNIYATSALKVSYHLSKINPKGTGVIEAIIS